jgi:imidazole glycerol-phosphate synthase subunit HisF
MLQARIIPCLLLKNKGLVKTVRFKDARYIGDPINAVRIFNEKEVDELIFLDIMASRNGEGPNLELVAKISDECNMPLAYGGGVRTLEQVRALFNAGVEKVSINSIALERPSFIKEASDLFGSQSIIVSLDVKRKWNGAYEVYIAGGTRLAGRDAVAVAKKAESLGAGEIMINSIDHDGTMEGYDIGLIGRISRSVGIPVIACGGAGSMEDFSRVICEGGASAAAAGSYFVYHGRRRAVLINYPTRQELNNILAV